MSSRDSPSLRPAFRVGVAVLPGRAPRMLRPKLGLFGMNAFVFAGDPSAPGKTGASRRPPHCLPALPYDRRLPPGSVGGRGQSLVRARVACLSDESDPYRQVLRGSKELTRPSWFGVVLSRDGSQSLRGENQAFSARRASDGWRGNHHRQSWQTDGETGTSGPRAETCSGLSCRHHCVRRRLGCRHGRPGTRRSFGWVNGAGEASP
jgi:hypothetical protein